MEGKDDLNSEEALNEMKGAFVDSLKRNNKKIRQDRAVAIAESAELLYKRKVEDLDLQIKELKRTREAMLDLSPSDAQSLLPAIDFNGAAFVEKDVKLGIQIRELQIQKEIAETRYKHLFS